MRRVIVHAALTAAGVALLLAGCGFADSRAPVPEFMRAKISEPPPEPPPDVRQTVRNNLDSVFVNTSYPQKIRVSPPRRDGQVWTACVRAEVTSVNGKPLGDETYRVTLGSGMILDRRRADAGDSCASENYEPI
jgi:hypothetical protein